MLEICIFSLFYCLPLNHFSVPLHHRPPIMVTPQGNAENNRKRIARANAEEKASLEVFERRYQLWKQGLDWTHGRSLKPQVYQSTVREFRQRLAEEIKEKINPGRLGAQRQDLAPDARQVSNRARIDVQVVARPGKTGEDYGRKRNA